MKKYIICLIAIVVFLLPVSATNQNNKIIYLTFDDGPSQIGTDKILDILDKYDIKATFFIVGEFASYYPERVKSIYKAGHIIGCHTCTHDYSKIYTTSDGFMNEVYDWEEIVYEIVGTELPYRLIRFPGGSKNKVLDNEFRNELIASLHSDGYRIYDWTISNNDAHVMKNMTPKSIEEYIKQAFIQSLDKIGQYPSEPKIILMHDIKKYTADTLEWTIEYLLDCGYSFNTLDKISNSYLY